MGADTLDLDAARAAFEDSTDFTVGIEEEFALLAPGEFGLVQRFEELCDAALAADPVLAESITGELISSEIEIRSGRGDDIHAARFVTVGSVGDHLSRRESRLLGPNALADQRSAHRLCTVLRKLQVVRRHAGLVRVAGDIDSEVRIACEHSDQRPERLRPLRRQHVAVGLEIDFRDACCWRD